jgi:hypothetical protein
MFSKSQEAAESELSEIAPSSEKPLLSLGKPVGMLSDWEDVTWTYGLRRSGRPMCFRWTRKMANGKAIHHPENASFWELARRYQTILRNNLQSETKQLALSTIFQRTHILLAICDFAIKFGVARLSGFSGEHFAVLLEAFKAGRTGFSEDKVTKGHLLIVLGVCDDLHRLYEYPGCDGFYFLNDGFRFSLFPSRGDRVAISKGLPNSVETDDVPEDIVFAHVAAAIEYVALYSADILRLRQLECSHDLQPNSNMRARPGASVSKVASWLHCAIHGDDEDGLLANGSVDKRKLSHATGVDLPSLYKERFSALIVPVEKWLASSKPRDLAVARRVLEAHIFQPGTRAPRGQHRGDRSSGLGLPYFGVPGKFAPWPITSVGSARWDPASLEAVSADLWTSCYLLILAYIAVREGEALTVKVGCIVSRVDGLAIRYFTSKGANHEGGTLVEKACPEIVARAVEVMESLGAAARQIYRSDDLFFIDHRAGASVPESSAVRKRLVKFGARTGASATKDGQVRPIVPTELRRFFVTMWINYYEYAGQYESLRRFLNHSWITTTVRYGKRRDEAPKLSDAQLELSVKVLARKLLDGAGPLSGIPKSILPFLQSLRVRALPTPELLNELREYARDQCFLVFPMPWGYCLWHNSAGKFAQCLDVSLRRVGAARIDGQRTCVGCDGCQNLLRDHVFEPFYESGRDRHAAIAANPHAPSSIRSAAEQFVEIAARTLNEGVGRETVHGKAER